MKNCFGHHRRQCSESGSATFVFIALLAIMLILVTANSRALFHLHRQTVLLEQKQVKKWTTITLTTIATNAPAPAISEPK